MNKEIISEKNYKFRQVLKKNIPSKYKRQSSLENKNLRIKKRSDSIKRYEAINNNNTFLNMNNSNAKSSLDIIKTQKNVNKRHSPKPKKINKYITKEDNIHEKGFNSTNIIIILDNKEKAKTFNRHASSQKLNVINNNKPNNHVILNNKKNNNLLRVKSGAFKLNKTKMLNKKKSSNDKINNIEKIEINKNLVNKLEKTSNYTKRNTDSIITIKNKANIIKQKKNKMKSINNKNNQNKINKKPINNKILNKFEIRRQKSEDNIKINLQLQIQILLRKMFHLSQ